MKKYFCHKIENLLVVNKIVTLHYFSFDKGYKSRGESHDFWEVVYADHESLVCTADGREIQLGEGEALFHKPNEFHTLAANGEKGPSVLIVSFVCHSEAMRFFEDRRVRLTPECRSLLYKVLEEGKKTFNISVNNPDTKKMEFVAAPALGGQQVMKNYLELFFVGVMRALTETKSERHELIGRGEWNRHLVKYILQLMEKNIDGHLSIDDICRETKYSRAYIFREFKSATGESIIYHFNRMKIERAAELLKEGKLSVKEISESLNFDTPNYFSRTFKQFTGMTPSVYRYEHRKGMQDL